MPPRKVRRKALIPDILQRAQEYLLNRSMRERSAYYEDTYKKEFMAHLAEVGEPTATGHRMLTFEAPLEFVEFKGGKPVEKKIIGFERRKRSGQQVLNEERTMAYLSAKGMLDECTTTHVVLNEDAVLAANYDGRISDKDLQKLYDQGEDTYAFHLIEER
jgi:hypothetical protein